VSHSVTWSERAISAGSRFLADDPEGLAQVLDATDRLADNPHPAGAFPYGSDDLLRIRVGSYRVLYEIDRTMHSITVLHVGRVALRQ
jgi:mRNA interferase RelE/StbE